MPVREELTVKAVRVDGPAAWLAVPPIIASAPIRTAESAARSARTVIVLSFIDPSAASYAKALEGLHAGMAQLDVGAPHFNERVSEAERLLRSAERTPRLEDTDRELLLETLRSFGSRDLRAMLT